MINTAATSTTLEGIMDITESDTNLAVGDRVEAHRAVIGQSLDEIALDVESALRDAGLTFPLFLVVPSSGNPIITMATSLDPPDSDWGQASDIVRRLVAEKLGGIKLGSRPLQCSVANARFGAADVMPEPTSE
jgi:hypothetical protein